MDLNKLKKRAIELGVLSNGGGRYVLKYPIACLSAYCPCIECPKDCPHLEARLLYNQLDEIN
jgi:hypothetical protein